MFYFFVSKLFSAKTLSIARIPAAGVWPDGLPCRGNQPLTRHAVRPSIPLLGAYNAATVKHPG
jgi:hypothetical protein